MNMVKFFMASLLVGLVLTLTGYTSSRSIHDQNLRVALNGDSSDYHVAAIQHHEGNAAILEGKILKLQERIEKFNRKAY